jgi:hypothetical protein
MNFPAKDVLLKNAHPACSFAQVAHASLPFGMVKSTEKLARGSALRDSDR